MLLRIRIIVAIALGLAGGVTHLPAADWGTIEGQFIASGKAEIRRQVIPGVPDDTLVVNPKTQGIANIAIYRRKAPVEIYPEWEAVPKEELVVERIQFRFEPQMTAVRVGQTVRFLNSDKTIHNVHLNPVQGDVLNFNLQPMDSLGVRLSFDKAESMPMKITDDIRSWRSSYLLVLDHPYMAVTDINGRFKIENLPAGEHSFRVWHERQGYLNQDYKVTVEAGRTIMLPVVSIPVEKLAQK